MKKAILVVTATLAVAFINLWLWMPAVSIAGIAINLGLTAFVLSQLNNLKRQQLNYGEYSHEADKWLTSLMVLSISFFFIITTLVAALHGGAVLSTILATAAPFAFLLYLLLFPQHPDEKTIYEYFEPPKP